MAKSIKQLEAETDARMEALNNRFDQQFEKLMSAIQGTIAPVKADIIVGEPTIPVVTVKQQESASKFWDESNMKAEQIEAFLISVWHHRSKERGLWIYGFISKQVAFRLYYREGRHASDKELTAVRKELNRDKRYESMYNALRKADKMHYLKYSARTVKKLTAKAS